MTKTQIEGLVYAGTIAIDSGQAMVGDPCYLDTFEHWADGTSFNHQEKAGEYGYLGACGVTLKDKFGQLGESQAVVFSTGYGDGLYPVYVKLNDDERVSMVVIDFDNELGDDE